MFDYAYVYKCCFFYLPEITTNIDSCFHLLRAMSENALMGWLGAELLWDAIMKYGTNLQKNICDSLLDFHQ